MEFYVEENFGEKIIEIEWNLKTTYFKAYNFHRKLRIRGIASGCNSIIWKTVNVLKFCDFEKLQSLFYSEMNHLELCVIEYKIIFT